MAARRGRRSTGAHYRRRRTRSRRAAGRAAGPRRPRARRWRRRPAAAGARSAAGPPACRLRGAVRGRVLRAGARGSPSSARHPATLRRAPAPHRRNHPTSARAAWVVRSGSSDDAVLVRVGGGRGARGDAELGEDVAHVAVHGPHAEHELGGDRLVGLRPRRAGAAPRARARSARGRRGAGGRAERVEAGEVRRRSRARRTRARAASSSSAAASSSPSAAAGEARRAPAHARRLVRRLQLAARRSPARRSATQRAAGVALGQLDRAARLAAIAPSAPPSWPLRDHARARRSASRAASTSPTASMISTQAGSRPTRLPALGRLRQRPADRGRRRRRPALREPQQGEAGLRLAPVPARLAVGRLGRGELAAQAVDLALPVAAPRRRPPGSRPARQRSPARRASSSASGHAPCELHDLGAVDQAAPGEGDQVGLALAPARQRGGPLLGAPHLVRVLAGEDHAAVDDPGDDRRELAGGHRHHRLVEQRRGPP